MWSFVKAVAIGVPVGLTVFDYVGYIARVEGISMQPSLNPRAEKSDYVFLSRFNMQNFGIRKGEIISCVSPKNRKQMIIKRVTGLEGDIIRSTKDIENKRYFKIPDGHCWIEGDHTGFSLDSNTFGPIPVGLIVAKAKCIVWPPDRWQLL